MGEFIVIANFILTKVASEKMDDDKVNPDGMTEGLEGGQRRRRKRGFDIGPGPEMGNS